MIRNRAVDGYFEGSRLYISGWKGGRFFEEEGSVNALLGRNTPPKSIPRIVFEKEHFKRHNTDCNRQTHFNFARHDPK